MSHQLTRDGEFSTKRRPDPEKRFSSPAWADSAMAEYDPVIEPFYPKAGNWPRPIR